MIQIKCGTCGTSQGYKTPKDGALSLPISEEARLVSRGVAAYVTKPVIGPAPAVATPTEGEEDDGAGVYHPNGAEGAESEETAHLDPDQLKELTNAKLRELAKDMGIDTSKLKTKPQLIAAIANVPPEDAIPEDSEDDGDEPPELGTEEPVE